MGKSAVALGGLTNLCATLSVAQERGVSFTCIYLIPVAQRCVSARTNASSREVQLHQYHLHWKYSHCIHRHMIRHTAIQNVSHDAFVNSDAIQFSLHICYTQLCLLKQTPLPKIIPLLKISLSHSYIRSCHCKGFVLDLKVHPCTYFMLLQYMHAKQKSIGV